MVLAGSLQLHHVQSNAGRDVQFAGEPTIEYVLKHVAEHGPYDGILSMSQVGCAAARLLCSQLLNQHRLQGGVLATLLLARQQQEGRPDEVRFCLSCPDTGRPADARSDLCLRCKL